MSSVHAIVYVSTKNQNQRGSLINAGVTGIAGLWNSLAKADVPYVPFTFHG